jgi:protein tyrosine phosphatase
MVFNGGFNRPKTRRGKKHLEDRAPKAVENDKMAIIIRGSKTSETIQSILQQLKSLKKPLIQQLQQFVFLFNFFA